LKLSLQVNALKYFLANSLVIVTLKISVSDISSVSIIKIDPDEGLEEISETSVSNSELTLLITQESG
jgi:hypothetical protein